MPRLSPPGWLLAALVTLAPASVALGAGLPGTIDGGLHLQRTLSVAYLLEAAPGWPRWAPHFLQGWGYPIHHFYPPGVPLAAAVLTNAGARPESAHVALVAFAWFLAAVGTYRLARTALPPSAALLSAGVAAFSAVRLFEVHVQGNLPQLVAAAWLPWALRATVDAVRDPGLRTAVTLGVYTAAIALCHHVTVVLALPVLCVLAAFEVAGTRAARRLGWRAALSVGAGLGFAAMLSAVYLLPAVLDAPRVQLAKAGQGMFDAAAGLVPLFEMVGPLSRVDRTALTWPYTHGFGPAVALLAMLGAAALMTPTRAIEPLARTRALRLSAVGVMCLLPVLPWSAPFWHRAGLIGLVQFPWRMLGVAEPLVAVPVGAALLWLPEGRRAAGLVVGLALVAASALPWLPPIARAAPVTDVTARAAVAEERRPDAAMGTTSSLEYLPRGAEPDLGQPPPPAALNAYAEGRWWIDVDRDQLPAGITATVEPLGRRGSVVVFGPGPAAAVRLRQLMFPGWRAEIDGRGARVHRAPSDGALVVDLPASGRPRRLVVAFTGTAIARGAGLLSACAWLLAAFVLLGSARRRRAAATPDSSAEPSPEPSALAWTDLPPSTTRALALGLIVCGALGPVVVPRWRWLSPRSALEAPEGMRREVRAVFADSAGPAVELLGVNAPASASAGRPIEVRLYWRAVRPLDRRYRPFVQLVTKGTRSVLANHTATDPGGRPTRQWPPDRFTVDVHRVVPMGDAPIVTVRLVAGLFDDDTGARLHIPSGADAVSLGDVRLRPAWLAPPAGPVREHVVFEEGARLGDAIRLERASAVRIDAPGGAAVQVTLHWRAVRPPGDDLTVFRHVLDAQGRSIAQLDGPPAQGDAPTSDWQAGDRVIDTVTVPLPADGSPPARMAVGLYEAGSGRRLPANGPRGRWPDDAVSFEVTDASTLARPRTGLAPPRTAQW